jgi:hypothetical protein
MLTVGELRKVIENVPDDARVEIVSDTGVDQGLGDIVVEYAYYQSFWYNDYQSLCIMVNDTGEE